MAKTEIQWSDAVWNPLGGCKEISPGCLNCYAAKMANRLAAMGQEKYAGTTKKLGNGKVVWTGKINMDDGALTIPLGWKKPKKIFVNSMSDMFHEDVPDRFIDLAFAVMALAEQHTFQVLTKRPERMREYVVGLTPRADEWWGGADDNAEIDFLVTSLHDDDERERDIGFDLAHKWINHDTPYASRSNAWPPPNVHLGVSVENRQHGTPRIDVLREIPAVVRFLSVEPLLEDLGELDLTGIGWVIVGGESGPGARPMHPDWVRSIRDQCQAAGVPFFFKQWGEWAEDDGRLNERGKHPWAHTWLSANGQQYGGLGAGRIRMRKFGKEQSGCMLDGREWNEFPSPRS